MAIEKDHTSPSFGRYLQEIRIEKGISLETVSKQTRIRLETLVQLEAEDHAHLPQQAFVKGFLRAYAKVIGADGDEAVRRYVSRLDMVGKIARSDADLNRSRKKFWPRLILSLLILVSLIALTLFAVSLIRKYPETSDKPTPAMNRTPADKPAAAAAPLDARQIEPVPLVESSGTEKYSLKIESTQETWMQVTIDDQDPIEYTLAPGDRIDLEALSGYKLVIGNAGGVTLILNDQPVRISGSTGQVVNLELP